jgi:hypothetical protein
MTPRERFQSTTDATSFLEMVNSATFQRGLDAAQLEFMDSMPTPKDEFSERAVGHQIQGMRVFRSLLMTVGAVDKPTPTPNTPSVYHRT